MKTFGLCVAVLAAAVLTAPFAAARPDAAAKHAVIRSVAFEMLEGEAPVVILHGSGFGIQPTPSPGIARHRLMETSPR